MSITKEAEHRVGDAVNALARFDIDVLKAAPDDELVKLKAEAQRVYRLLGGTSDELREIEEAEVDEAA